MLVSSKLRRSIALVPCILGLGLISGCGEGASTAPPPPPANLPVGAPTAPVDSKKLMDATKGGSSAAFDSTINTSLQKGTAPPK